MMLEYLPESWVSREITRKIFILTLKWRARSWRLLNCSSSIQSNGFLACATLLSADNTQPSAVMVIEPNTGEIKNSRSPGPTWPAASSNWKNIHYNSRYSNQIYPRCQPFSKFYVLYPIIHEQEQNAKFNIFHFKQSNVNIQAGQTIFYIIHTLLYIKPRVFKIV